MTERRTNWLGVTVAAAFLAALLLGPLVLVCIQTGLAPVDRNSFVLWVVWKRVVYPHDWLIWTSGDGSTGRLAHPLLTAWAQWFLVVCACLWAGRSWRLSGQVALAIVAVLGVGLLVNLLVLAAA